MSRRPESVRAVAEAGWRWVLDQVRHDDAGPWIPESVPADGEPAMVPAYRDGMHSGIGGLGLALADIRLTRAWTDGERRLANAIAARLRANIATTTDYGFFDGLVSTIGVLIALGADGVGEVGTVGQAGGVDQVDQVGRAGQADPAIGTDRPDGQASRNGWVGSAVARLLALATPDGWPQTFLTQPRFRPGARVNDVVLGTAGVLLGAVWAHRAGVPGAAELADRAAGVLLAEAEPTAAGLDWPFVPLRFRTDADTRMPNFSHGLAGIATALALAGAGLGRPDLSDAARRGAEHLVTLGDTRGRGFTVPHYIPHGDRDEDEVTYSWCHGPTGTSLLFPALDRAGITDIAGAPPATWQRRCLHSTRTSGLPARTHPGFWDNDGRCCGTAGVGEVFLDSWQRAGHLDDLEFGRHLADTLVERATLDGDHAYWRFVEHRAPGPLLPPGVGWLQGAAGIAAFLFRAERVLREGRDAAVLPRMDAWWAVRPGQPSASSSSSFL